MRFRAFSRQQRRVLTWWCSAEGQSREAVICDGAVRSGKTLCMGLAFFLWATACFDGMAFGLCGKTITALRLACCGRCCLRWGRWGSSGGSRHPKTG